MISLHVFACLEFLTLSRLIHERLVCDSSVFERAETARRRRKEADIAAGKQGLDGAGSGSDSDSDEDSGTAAQLFPSPSPLPHTIITML